jgi:hypothetical protein
MVGRIKNISIKSRRLLIAIALIIIALPCLAQIEAEGCFTSNGTFKPCWSKWTDSFNGVRYSCYCDCAKTPPADCTPESSSSGSSSSGYSPEVQMAQDILQPVFDNFFNWLFSEPSAEDQQKQQQQKQQKQLQKQKAIENEKNREEYKAKVLEQITNAKSEYKKQMSMQSQEQKEITVENFKIRYAVSEATKAVKQLNCAAYTSLQALEVSLKDFGDFKDIDGPAEQSVKSADFTLLNSSGCPTIKIDIPEVNATQTVSFQQLLYGYVKHRSDSIKSTIDTLKVKKIKNDKVIEEKKQKIEETKLIIEKQKEDVNTAVNTEEANQLLIDAMKELETGTQELQYVEELEIKMKEEIELKEKNFQALEKMRGTYDTDKN